MALLNNLTDSTIASEKYVAKNRSARYGRITSANGDGSVNSLDNSALECRNAKVVCPQGISATPLESVSGQIVENEENQSVIGVFDPNRPTARPGEIILYSGGAQISVYNGTINITGNVNITGSVAINGSLTVNGKSVPCGICV